MKRRLALGLAWLVSLALITSCKMTKTAERDGECICENGCIEACSTGDGAATRYRMVKRGDQPGIEDSGEPFVPADPTVADVAVELPDGEAHSFRADFAPRTGDGDLALIQSDGTLEIRDSDGDRIARTDLGEVIDVQPVRLVDDRVELAVRHRDDDGVLHFTVLRVIGESIARVFTIELTDRDGAPLREVDFVHRGDEQALRVTPADGGDPEVYRWNRWEGMFRVPTVPPTAPGR